VAANGRGVAARPTSADEDVALAPHARGTGYRDCAARRPGGEREHALHVERARAAVPGGGEPGAHDPPLERRRLRRDRDAQRVAGAQGRPAGRGDRVEEVVLVAQPLRERGDRRAEAGVELGLEERHDEPPHAVPRRTEVGVRAVDGEVEAALGEEAAHVGARRGEERTKEPAAHRSDAAEAAPSRAAHEAEEHRLDLVVAGVAGDDARRADLGAMPRAHDSAPARARLQVRAGGTGDRATHVRTPSRSARPRPARLRCPPRRAARGRGVPP
jgi:hypothetical protein